jgi:hypothetical protein
MPTLQSALSRLGAARLAELSGGTTIKLLEALDIHNLAPNRLADLVMRQFGAERLLLNAPLRKELLAALQRDDAERLCRLIGINDDRPWDRLEAVRFQKGQARTDVLFEFFSEVPPGMDEESEPSNIEEINPSYPLFTHQIQTYNDVLSDYCRRDSQTHYTTEYPCKVRFTLPGGAGFRVDTTVKVGDIPNPGCRSLRPRRISVRA